VQLAGDGRESGNTRFQAEGIMAISTGTMPKQIKAGREQSPKGTTSFTPKAAARFSADLNCSRRSLAACAYKMDADGAPVRAANASAFFSRKTSGACCAGVRQAVSQSAPMAKAATTGLSDWLMGGEADLASSSNALPIPAPASSIEATSSSIMAVSRRPSAANLLSAAVLPTLDGPDPGANIQMLRLGIAKEMNAARTRRPTINGVQPPGIK